MKLHAFLALAVCAVFVLPVRAETFLVTRFDDPQPDACDPSDCSLREAAEAAAQNDPFAGGDQIVLAAGAYTLVRGPLSSAHLELELVGAGSMQTRIDTDAELFDGPRGGSLTIRGATVATTDYVGIGMTAISRTGRLVLDDVVVPVGGGAVVAGGSDGFESSLEVTASELRDNVQCNMDLGACAFDGSTLNSLNVNPIDLPGPSVQLRGTTVDGTQDADGLLTGIVVHHAVIVELVDSTVSATSNGILRPGADSYTDPLVVRLQRVTYSGNANPFRPAHFADVEIVDSVFRDNPARAIYAEGESSWFISGSTFANNRVDSTAGGAILVEDSATVGIANSTFSGNSFTVDAAGDGARGAAIGWRNGSGARVDLQHVTIVRPAFMPVGVLGTAIGGYGGSGEVVINVANSLLSGSCRFDAGALHQGIGNIESASNSCGFDPGSNQVSVDADDLAVGALGDHGGPTPTFQPGEGSVAIDAAAADSCSELDQRGYPRPFGAGCDVGAVEVGAEALFADGFDG